MESIVSNSNEESSVDDEEHCIICLFRLSDFAPLMRPSAFFVSECKCKYLAHEQCMTAWVKRQINEHKQMLCPHCNSVVTLTVNYGMFLNPHDTCIDMPLILPDQRRRQNTCETEICWSLCGCICGFFFLAFILAFIF
jgi:hypothetical protein